jgi:hypothetical protein
MLKDVLTEVELQALLGEEANGAPVKETLALFENDDKKLLHALVRNQLRQLHMIEELQSELRKVKSAALGSARGGDRESAAGLEPLPLPFMKTSAASGQAGGSPTDGDPFVNGPGEEQKAPAADVSRKERFKRKSIW